SAFAQTSDQVLVIDSPTESRSRYMAQEIAGAQSPEAGARRVILVSKEDLLHLAHAAHRAEAGEPHVKGTLLTLGAAPDPLRTTTRSSEASNDEVWKLLTSIRRRCRPRSTRQYIDDRPLTHLHPAEPCDKY